MCVCVCVYVCVCVCVCVCETDKEKHFSKSTALFQFSKIFLVRGKLVKVKKVKKMFVLVKKCFFVSFICYIEL